MKIIFTIIAAVLITAGAFAQAPEKMSYQAVVKDADNALVTSQVVGMQISILQSTTYIPVYVETQTPTTNANGIISLEIGEGTIVSGDFTTIDWANGPYYIKTETDPTGGTTYTITGTSQLISIPYALHAKTAASITGGTGIAADIGIKEADPVYSAWDKSTGITITESQISDLTHTVDTDTQLDSTGITKLGFVAGDHTVNTGDHTVNTEDHTVNIDTQLDSTGITKLGFIAGDHNTYTAGAGIDITNNTISTMDGGGHYVGEFFDGGIVCYVYDNGTHGLIASLDDLNGGDDVQWYNGIAIFIGAVDFYNGAVNTATIVNSSTTFTATAASLCNNYSNEGFSDWYLPSNIELRQMDVAALTINNILINDGDSTTNPLNLAFTNSTNGRYWSSSEIDLYNSWGYDFSYGGSITIVKTSTLKVRAVRAF